MLDQTTFEKYFERVDPAAFRRDGQELPLREGEVRIQTYRMVNKNFIFDISPAIKALEAYLTKEFGVDVPFPYVREEP